MSESTVTALDVLDASTGSAVSREIQNLAAGTAAFYSTIQGNDFATKIATIEAMTNSVPVKENLNTTINLANVIVQSIPMPNERTGEIEDQPRIVLLDADGTAYHAISGGLWRSIQNILGVLPHPSVWPAPVPLHVISAKGRQGDFYTVKMGVAPAKK